MRFNRLLVCVMLGMLSCITAIAPAQPAWPPPWPGDDPNWPTVIPPNNLPSPASEDLCDCDPPPYCINGCPPGTIGPTEIEAIGAEICSVLTNAHQPLEGWGPNDDFPANLCWSLHYGSVLESACLALADPYWAEGCQPEMADEEYDMLVCYAFGNNSTPCVYYKYCGAGNSPPADVGPARKNQCMETYCVRASTQNVMQYWAEQLATAWNAYRDCGAGYEGAPRLTSLRMAWSMPLTRSLSWRCGAIAMSALTSTTMAASTARMSRRSTSCRKIACSSGERNRSMM